MTSGHSSPEIPKWSRRRWAFCIMTAFLAQTGAFWLFTIRTPLAPRPHSSATRFQLLGDPTATSRLAQRLNIQDPTLFASANPNGFSGVAWLKPQTQTNELQDWIAPNPKPEPQFYMRPEFNLASVPTMPSRNHSTASKPPPAETRMPIRRELVSTNSWIAMQGPITQRPLAYIEPLPAWPGAGIWQPTVVEITVDPDGEVLSSRLLSSCGFSPADQQGLRISRQMRFAPLTVSNPAGSMQGRLTFYWAATASVQEPKK